MKKIIVFLVLIVSSSAFSQEFVWAKSTRSILQGYCIQQSIASDINGNVFTTGTFLGQLDADPNEGEEMISANNSISPYNFDVYIRKFTADGNLLWVKTIGGAQNDYQYGIETDLTGNVYVTGANIDTIDLNPNAGIDLQTASGIFVIKLDPNGEYIWGKSITNATIEPNAMKLNSAGDVFVSGMYSDTVDFDPGIGTEILTPIHFTVDNVDYPSIDAFLLKLNTDGSFGWAKSYGGAGLDECISIDLDATGNIYSGGWFFTTADLDPSAGTEIVTPHSSLSDYYIQKLSPNGDFLWAHGFGSPQSASLKSVAATPSGEVFLTGTFRGLMDFDPGQGEQNRAALSLEDMYLQKLSPTGDFLWVKQFSDPLNEFSPAVMPEDLVSDQLGNIYVSGYLDNPADNNDPALGQSKDIFVKRFTSTGAFEWEHLIEGKDTHLNSRIALTTGNDLLISGLYVDTTDFDPGSGEFLMSEINQVFVAKWGQEPLGLTETEKQNFTVYPNPFTDNLSVQLNDFQETISVNIFEINGKLIQSSEFSNTDKIDLNLSGFSGGTYLLSLNYGEVKATTRLVKY